MQIRWWKVKLHILHSGVPSGQREAQRSLCQTGHLIRAEEEDLDLFRIFPGSLHRSDDGPSPRPAPHVCYLCHGQGLCVCVCVRTSAGAGFWWSKRVCLLLLSGDQRGQILPEHHEVLSHSASGHQQCKMFWLSHKYFTCYPNSLILARSQYLVLLKDPSQNLDRCKVLDASNCVMNMYNDCPLLVKPDYYTRTLLPWWWTCGNKQLHISGAPWQIFFKFHKNIHLDPKINWCELRSRSQPIWVITQEFILKIFLWKRRSVLQT